MGARGRRGRRGGGRGGGDGSASASGSKRPRRVVEEEEEEEEAETGEDQLGEDYCFICKDGGELRVCDFRGCNKAYHPGCVEKDSNFLYSDEEFICEWHTCYICKGRSRYFCFCCPRHTFCKGCVAQAEFVPVLRKTKGFCSNCLRMAIMIERNVDVDSDGERVDFSDRETYEFLFKDYYWEIVKDKEGLTLDKLEKAYVCLKRGLNFKQADLEKVSDEEHSSDNEFLGNSDDGGDEPASPSDLNKASKKRKSCVKEVKSKKNGYVSWGSEKLIDFLSSIGKDTSNSLDQIGAAEVVKEYIQQKNLLQKDKKKLVICDDKLQSLFRKSKLKYARIYSLLERHITANMTSEDETLVSSEDNNDSSVTKKARTVKCESSTPKRTSVVNKKCFASLVCENIKLIYLKRSLVMDLLKEPDTFESKVTGCFVRIKNDPKDYSYHMHKKLYQLGQVTGIRKSSEEYKIRGDTSTDILLCVSNLSDLKISKLSDDDFEEDECDDLRVLAQKGYFKRLTVGELEEKARSIHRDIMSHWINKELQRLEKLIDLAHEKGWRSEMYQYMDKKKLLREPSERQRLLEEAPQVIPDKEDDTKLQVTAQDKSIEDTVAFQGTNGERVSSSKRFSEEKSEGTNGRIAYFKSCSEEKSKGTNQEGAFSLRSCSEEKSKGTNREGAFSLRSCSEEKSKGTDGERPLFVKSSSDEKSKAPKADANGGTAGMHVWKQDTEATEANTANDIPCVQKQDTEATKADAGGDTFAIVQRQRAEVNKANTARDTPRISLEKQGAEAGNAGTTLQVITIEDDGDDLHEKVGKVAVVDLEADICGDNHPVEQKTNNTLRRRAVSQLRRVWYYIDPQGDEQGPFTIEHLRHWWDGGHFPHDFRVWRTGQTSDSAVLLREVLQVTR